MGRLFLVPQDNYKMRIPTKIEPFYVLTGKSEFSKNAFLQILDSTIKKTLDSGGRPGILLSGGIDSSLLAILAVKHYPDIPCFVIGQYLENADVQAAWRLAKEKSLNLYVHLLNSEEISVIQRELKECAGSTPLYAGDECVLAALKFAAPIVNNVIATDGIDELMGGYWGHRDRKRFPDVKDAFKYFWDELEEKHLSPMYRSANLYNLSLTFVYLFPRIVQYLSLIPLDDRIKGNVGKAVWREIAQMAGVPSWIIKRQKRGFVDAFN